jgi:ribosomal protein S27AE
VKYFDILVDILSHHYYIMHNTKEAEMISESTREKMRQAKLRNPTRFWLGKGDLLRKAIQDIKSKLPDYVRDEILERDNNRCVKCGSPKRPHVHHIDKRDGRVNTTDPPNHSANNLITLCPKCHEGVHQNHILAIKSHWPISKSVTLICNVCGKTFIASNWEIKQRYGRKYCSRECSIFAKIGRPNPRGKIR